MRLTKKALRSYLEANKTKTFTRGRIDLCPIAGFYTDNGAEYVAVYSTQTYVNKGTVQNPKWAREFISRVDYGTNDQYITGEQALAVLEKAA